MISLSLAKVVNRGSQNLARGSKAKRLTRRPAAAAGERRLLSTSGSPPKAPSPLSRVASMDKTVEKILNLARWAPSGDNTQPWRFELLPDPLSIRVHSIDHGTPDVYDMDGHSGEISMGAFLETVSIASSNYGMKVDIQRDTESKAPQFLLKFTPSSDVTPSNLVPMIEKRTVQRKPFNTRPLTDEEFAHLRASVGPEHDIHWITGFSGRFTTASLLFRSAKLRLTMKEAWEVHNKVIEWNAQFSKDRMPDQALGASTFLQMAMRVIARSWDRMHFFNRFLAGTVAPRLEMDFIPGIACAAHFVIVSKTAPKTTDDYVAAGRATQRLWLTATHLGLLLQPEVTPLIFARYVRKNIDFSTRHRAFEDAADVRDRIDQLLGKDISERAVFMGRVGEGKMPTSRSLRLDLQELMITPSSAAL